MNFIEFHNDVSMSTVILTLAGALAIWVLKKTLTILVNTLVDAIKPLIKKLSETISRVEILDSKMDVLTKAVGDHEKLRADIASYFEELIALKRKFEEFEFKNH